MFEKGQKVVVITDKGISYEAIVLAVAKDDEGTAAYKVALDSLGGEQLGQWHKACDVFVREEPVAQENEAWDSFIKP
jgi:hypothetical protein